MEQNQRKQPRLPFAVPVQVATPDQTIRGSSRDISTTGLYINTPHELEVDMHCQLTISLGNDTGEFVIRGQGKIVRQTQSPSGVGIKIEDMDAESQRLLWRVIRYNTPSGEEHSGE